MGVDVWFPLALYYEDLADSASLNDLLRKRIHELHATAPRRTTNDEAAWTGDVNSVERIHLDPAFEPLTAQVAQHAWQYLAKLGHDLDAVELHVQRAWPVVSTKGQCVSNHAHHNANLSAVYYVSVPEDAPAGKLRFLNASQQNELSPRATSTYDRYDPLNYQSAEYRPVEGRLLIFPAKQPHEVDVNESDAERISISYDLILSARADRLTGIHEFLMPPPQHWRRLGRPPHQPGDRVAGLALSTLSQYAMAVDDLVLCDSQSHPLWRTRMLPHCAGRRTWPLKQDDAPDAWRAQDDGTFTRPVPASDWRPFRDAVDQLYLHLRMRDVSPVGAHVDDPQLLGVPSKDIALPHARGAGHLCTYLRLDHDVGACAIEFADESDPLRLDPGALAFVSGFRRHRVRGPGTFLRFTVTVPSQARPVAPNAIERPDDPEDDLTVFLRATARPLDLPLPSAALVDEKRSWVLGQRQRRYRDQECPTARRFLIDNADPAEATAADRASIRNHGETTDEIVDRDREVVRHVPVLDEDQCSDLVALLHDHVTATVPDSVDDRPEYQVNLSVDDLASAIGKHDAERLLTLPAVAGGTTPRNVDIFLRRFSPETRRHIAFHSDTSTWTVNVALDDDEDFEGGRLLMLYGGALRAVPRRRGVAMSHPSNVVHGVSSVRAGERSSLIMFFHE